MSAASFLDPLPRPLAPSEQRAELEPLGLALRRLTALATEDARAAEAASPGTCLHCGEPTARGATLCDGCESCGDDCEECGPLDEDCES